MMKGADSAEAGGPGRGKVLPWRRNRVFQVIQEYVEANGCSPSHREIAQAVGLKSTSSVHHHLKQLKAAGLVTYDPRFPRTVRVLRRDQRATGPAEETGATPGDTPPAAGPAPENTDSQKVVWVPIVGQVAGGDPIPPVVPDAVQPGAHAKPGLPGENPREGDRRAAPARTEERGLVASPPAGLW